MRMTRAPRPPASTRTLAVAGVLFAASLVMAACGSGTAKAGSGDGDSLLVVASTNVYADIVKNVAGDRVGKTVTVDAIIDDPNKDPHDYEATTVDQLKLSKAGLVVQNGGGYDSFIGTMLGAADARPDVVSAVKVSGLPGASEAAAHDDPGTGEGDGAAGGGTASAATSEDEHEGHEGHDHGEFNEHVWYSIPTMVKVTDAVRDALAQKQPDNAQAFKGNAAKYVKQLESLNKKTAAVKKAHKGDRVAATEPVPLWMFDSMGLVNATPESFLEAVEEGDDVPPLVLKRAEEQISKKQVALLAYNTQAANKQGDQLKATAEAAGVPVVDLRETMPQDSTYVQWMGANIATIEKALG